MEIDKVFDIPAHPLFVHVPVVFVPLAAVGLLAIVIRPAWRVRYGWLVLGAAFVSAVGVQVATMSGEGLEDRIDKNPAIQHHTDLAGTARPLVFVFFVLVLAYVLVPWWAERGRTRTSTQAVGDRTEVAREQPPAWTRPVVAALAAASLVFAVLATTWVVRAGHQGSKATWQSTGENEQGGGG